MFRRTKSVDNMLRKILIAEEKMSNIDFLRLKKALICMKISY